MEAGIHNIRRRWLLSRDGVDEETLKTYMATKVLVNGDPESFEFKGEDLLQRRRLMRHTSETPSPSVQIVEECLALVRDCRSTSFGILSNPVHIDAIQKAERCPVQYVRLLDRINKWMLDAHPDRMAIPVFDSIHGGANSHLSRQIGQYLYRHARGSQMRKIVPTPFWIDSTTTAGSQMADIISHVLMNSMQPFKERKPIEFLWKRVVAMEAIGDGYRTVTRLKRQPAGRD